MDELRVIVIALIRSSAPQTVATVVNSLQNRVNSITLCITLNAKTEKIHTETQQQHSKMTAFIR